MLAELMEIGDTVVWMPLARTIGPHFGPRQYTSEVQRHQSWLISGYIPCGDPRSTAETMNPAADAVMADVEVPTQIVTVDAPVVEAVLSTDAAVVDPGQQAPSAEVAMEAEAAPLPCTRAASPSPEPAQHLLSTTFIRD